MKKIIFVLSIVLTGMFLYIGVLTSELNKADAELSSTYEEMTKAIKNEDCYLEWKSNGKTYKYIKVDGATIKVKGFDE